MHGDAWANGKQQKSTKNNNIQTKRVIFFKSIGKSLEHFLSMGRKMREKKLLYKAKQ